MQETRTVGEMGVAGDLETIEAQWEPLYELLNNKRVWDRRATQVSAWSVAEQLGHMALVMDFIADRIVSLLADPSKNVGDDIHPFAQRILPTGMIPRGVGDAPDGVRMEGAKFETVRKLLAQSRTKWEALSARAVEIESTRSRFPHHRLGMMTSAQWVRFIAIHTAHHLKIIDDILGAPVSSPADGA